MDNKLEAALDYANFSLTLEKQKLAAKRHFKKSIILTYESGTFTVSVELLSYCVTMMNEPLYEQYIIIDDNDIPIEIQDIKDFYTKARRLYYKYCKEYLNEYKRLVNKKDVKGLVLDE
jgi:hypothetical protein